MKINGKEIFFAHTIGSYCDFLDYCAKNPDVSIMRASCYKALFMNRAYTQAHPEAESITLEEILNLPGNMSAKLIEELENAENEGNRTSVETVEVQDSKKKENSK